jgi:hypothetical protein
LLWDVESFECEPYNATLQIRECFKCYKFGHIAKYCKKRPRCGHCAAAAHEQEDSCPQKQNSGIKRCINCSGKHTNWDRSCPIYKIVSDRARKAYTHRSRQFVVASSNASTKTSDAGRISPPIITQLPSFDGYTIISRKRGRPPGRSNSRSSSRASNRASSVSSSQLIHGYMLRTQGTDIAAHTPLSLTQ